MFSGGQYGPDAQIDTLGNALSGAVVTVPDGYVSALDALGNLTITGPATDALTYTITPVGGTPIARTVRVEPLVSELDSLLGGGEGGDSAHAGAGSESIQLGDGASSPAGGGIALGFGAASKASGAVVVGYNADSAISASDGVAIGVGAHAYNAAVVAVGELANVSGDHGVAIGSLTSAAGDHGTAIGPGAEAAGVWSVAIGKEAQALDDYAGVIKADSFEVSPASAVRSSLILTDSAGVRWKITVDTTGHLTTVAL